MSETPPPCRILEWDSRFFGCTVARIEQNRIDDTSCARAFDWCREHGVDWLYFLADADDADTVRVAQAAKFDFVDIRLVLAANKESFRTLIAERPPPEDRTPGGYTIRDAAPSDLTALEPIAATVHRDSRFFFDRRLPREHAEALFQTWIRKSVVEDFADHVLVADMNGTACGYISGRAESSGQGSIGLLGVGEAARGRGVGPALVRASLDRFAARGISDVSVVTQGRNVAAQRTYARCGFLSQSIHLWFHRWFT